MKATLKIFLILATLSILLFGSLAVNAAIVQADNTASPTPTPSVSPSPSATVTPTPTPTPVVQTSPTPTVPSFPACLSFTGPGDNAHYDSGLHQIVGNGLLDGQDDVYSISNGNYVQCFVPPLKDVCIQTDWWRTDLQSMDGWYSENGSQWNLGNFHYLARNHNYDCIPPSPTPMPTPVPTPTVTPSPTVTVINNTINNENHQEQKQENNQTVTVNNNNNGNVLGVKTTPETGVGDLGMAGMFSAGPFGFLLSKFRKGKISPKKPENINELIHGIVKSRTDRLS